MKNGLLLLIACLVFTLPAVAYASGCCCMKQNIMTKMADMPCHETMNDTAPDTDMQDHIKSDRCVCDQGLVSASILPEYALTSYEMAYNNIEFDEGIYQSYSTPVKRLLRPPITLM